MDTQTIDQEFEKLQTEFQDVATTVRGLAEKLQAAAKSGDANATEWLADLKQVAQDIDDEQTQAKVLLLAVHGLISNVAQASAAGTTATATEHPPLYAPGHEPQEAPAQQQPAGYYQPRGMMGGMMGGYFGGGFARAMEMGAGIGLGQSLISSIFR
jgi:hypothetical protein